MSGADGIRTTIRPYPFAVGLFLALAGCMSAGSQQATPAVAVTPAVATSAELVGDWGLGSYRQDADRARTEKQAIATCNNPYKIGSGQNGGVIMHLADQAQPSELYLKTASDGRVFLGPKGPAGTKPDRQIVSFDKGVLVTKFVDPSAADRYGILIYVRYPAGKSVAAKKA
jgi:hypothetical protein